MTLGIISLIVIINFLVICIIFGCIHAKKISTQLLKSRLAPQKEEAVYGYIITKPCGCGGSNNTDFKFADAIENQSFSVSVILKLIQ